MQVTNTNDYRQELLEKKLCGFNRNICSIMMKKGNVCWLSAAIAMEHWKRDAIEINLK